MGGPAPPGAAISASPSSNGTYTYGAASGYGGQPAGYQHMGQQQGQQQDYSAAWAQYYAQVIFRRKILAKFFTYFMRKLNLKIFWTSFEKLWTIFITWKFSN